MICGLFALVADSRFGQDARRDLRIRGASDVLFHRRKLLADRARLGRWGERRSERFLKRRGFKTLARNFSCRTGELDLVMVAPDGTVVFVEVKTRAGERFACTEAAITPGKKRRLRRAAHCFLAFHAIQDRICRFDVVTIVLGSSGPAEIRHYENAFGP
jgi:putative endonuclease